MSLAVEKTSDLPGEAAGPALVHVENLRVRFGSRRNAPVVDGVSFQVSRGECLALVGESGSGKSVTSRTLVGLTGSGSSLEFDRLEFEGRPIAAISERRWRTIRGKRIGFVLQDALSSLDGLRPVGREIAEPLRLHEPLTRAQREAKVVELLASVGVPEPEFRATQYPDELSGGLRQRALIASAIACSPELLIADEPTTALDATIAAQVVRLLASLKSEERGLLVVSHDLAVVAQLADRVAVMKQGRIVETGPTERVLHDPQHDYTKELLAAVPSGASKGTRLSAAQPASIRRDKQPGARAALHRPRPEAGTVLVEASGLVKEFTGGDGVRRRAVDQVSFELHAGEALGIVGESGSGKTTTARIVLGLEKPDEGEVLVRGRTLSSLPARELRAERRHLQVVYQDPLSSFDPRYTVERILSEAVAVAGVGSRTARRDRVTELLDLVRLDSSFLKRRPLEISGGQRQRIAIARALAAEPEVIVCDEPVSALDVSVQARILDLFTDLQNDLGLAYLFISHDLGVVHHVCDRVVVMKDGAVVESGEVDRIFDRPQHDYTRALLAAVPRLETRGA